MLPGVVVTLDDGLYPDKRLDVRVEPVGHQLKLPVRWDKGDRPVVLESIVIRKI